MTLSSLKHSVLLTFKSPYSPGFPLTSLVALSQPPFLIFPFLPNPLTIEGSSLWSPLLIPCLGDFIQPLALNYNECADYLPNGHPYPVLPLFSNSLCPTDYLISPLKSQTDISNLTCPKVNHCFLLCRLCHSPRYAG